VTRSVAFLLNYVPILGTALGVLIFLVAGMLTHDTLWQALLPGAGGLPDAPHRCNLPSSVEAISPPVREGHPLE
jgi:hypothetical protein